MHTIKALMVATLGSTVMRRAAAMRVVAALGGNALLERGERPDAVIQQRHVRQAAAGRSPRWPPITSWCSPTATGRRSDCWRWRAQADTSLTRPYPLDVLGAQTQGMIGYWIAQELRNAGVAQPVVVRRQPDGRRPGRPRVRPSHQVHRRQLRARAKRGRWRRGWGWAVAADGPHWRRVVASPRPGGWWRSTTVRSLARRGRAGGLRRGRRHTCGPVGHRRADAASKPWWTRTSPPRSWRSPSKPTACCILTDVPGIVRGYGTPGAQPIPAIDAGALSAMTFPAGSMGPKVEACLRFVTASGQPAAIGALTGAADTLAGGPEPPSAPGPWPEISCCQASTNGCMCWWRSHWPGMR